MRSWHNGRFDHEVEADLDADEAAERGYESTMAQDYRRHRLERDLHSTTLALISEHLPESTRARLEQRRADAMEALDQLRAQEGRPCLRH